MTTSFIGSALAGMLALAVAMGIGRFAFTPILPEMQQAHGLTLVAAGWLASANYLGYLVGALAAGRARASARGALRAGLASVVISTLAMGVTGTLGAWLALRFLAGVASAFVLVFVSSWSLERFQAAASARKRSFASATLFAGVGVGIALAGATCVQLWRAHASPDTAWIVLGLIAAAASALLWGSFGESGGPRAASAATASRWSATRARLVVCYGAFGFGYIIPATFIAAMTRDLGAAGSALGDWAWPVFGVSAVAGTFSVAALRERFSNRAIWGASHVLMAVGIVAPIAAHTLWAYMLSAILVGATLMSATMAGMQEARRVAGANARPLIAAMTSAFAVGQIAGPLFVAAVQTPQSRYDSALGVAAVLLAATAAVLIVLPNHPESP
jgi:predicted MFS family arabinose efflux permease